METERPKGGPTTMHGQRKTDQTDFGGDLRAKTAAFASAIDQT